MSDTLSANPIVRRRLEALRAPAPFEDVWALSVLQAEREVPVIRTVTWERKEPRRKKSPKWRKSETWPWRESVKPVRIPTDEDVERSIVRLRSKWARECTAIEHPRCVLPVETITAALARNEWIRRHESDDWITPHVMRRRRVNVARS